MSVEITTTETVTCKYCQSPAVQKYGNYKGVPRYFCKACRRKFKHDDKQFKMKTETEQVATAMHDYYDGGSSVRAIGRHILAETGKTPSTATIYEWIQKYSQYATDSVKDYHPKAGGVFIGDETMVSIGGQKYWLWDVIDSDTRFLLASRLSRTRTKRDAQMVMDAARKMAGREPQEVVTDGLGSYREIDYGKDTEHRQGSPFRTKDTGESTSQIERWHGTVKARTKVMRGLKNFETATEFVAGFLAFYNYIRPHESLDGRTPAAAAGIDYPYQNWSELISKHKPSKPIKVLHQSRATTAALKLLVPPYGHQRKPRLSQTRPIISKGSPRITPKQPRLS